MRTSAPGSSRGRSWRFMEAAWPGFVLTYKFSCAYSGSAYLPITTTRHSSAATKTGRGCGSCLSPSLTSFVVTALMGATNDRGSIPAITITHVVRCHAQQERPAHRFTSLQSPSLTSFVVTSSASAQWILTPCITFCERVYPVIFSRSVSSMFSSVRPPSHLAARVRRQAY